MIRGIVYLILAVVLGVSGVWEWVYPGLDTPEWVVGLLWVNCAFASLAWASESFSKDHN